HALFQEEYQKKELGIRIKQTQKKIRRERRNHFPWQKECLKIYLEALFIYQEQLYIIQDFFAEKHLKMIQITEESHLAIRK
ncbi:MAG: hypothetical protein KDD63_18275, partial [Bacteroidetes bacterium]|nr:hypothetical protein [Bacteroidota bacterium]